MICTVFKISTGQILRTVQCLAADMGGQLANDEFYIAGSYDAQTQYLVGSTTVQNKQECLATSNKTQITADGQDELVISNLPTPCVVFWVGVEEYEITDGAFEFSTDTPGDYRFQVRSVEYLDTEFDVEAI